MTSYGLWARIIAMKLFFVGIALLVASCYSTPPTRSFERSLRVGATKEELKRNGAEVTNCRGSPKGYERCEKSFWTGPGNILGDDPSYSQELNRSIVLHFNQGKLERWERADSIDFVDQAMGKAPSR